MNEVTTAGTDDQQADWALLLQRLGSSGQRLLVPLAADRGACLHRVERLRETAEVLVLSDRGDLSPAVPVSRASSLLGQESDWVVLDAFDRFSVDALCIAAGLVRAGGGLLLITPEGGAPAKDPDGRWQGLQGEGRLLGWLLDQMAEVGALWRPGSRVPLLPPVVETRFFGDLTEDQEWAVDWLNTDWPEMGPERVLLAADRGRGKSTLLGRYAAACGQDFIVTAPSRRHAAVLLEQLPEDQRSFVAPDELVRRGQRVELLIIDEAAMLPYSLLQDCLELADRALLASTLNGYEGTGQGFRLRFQRDQGERMRQLGLEQAVRWGQGDLLELGLNRSLLLQPEDLPPATAEEPLRIEAVDGAALIAQPVHLRQAQALMLSAHYRYRPSDLRQWLEDPNQRLYLARRGTAVVGVLQINEEGGFDEETAEAVFMGRRRPQGHLLAQMLTAQAGLRGFARHKGWRIQRIAVREEQRSQGIGRALIERAEQDAREAGMDWIGSSFALDAEVAPFWRACGYRALHLGRGRGKSSGRPAVAVLRAFNSELEPEVTGLARRLKRDLPLHLRGHARAIHPADVSGLLRLLDAGEEEAPPLQTDILAAVIDGHFGLDLAEAELARWLMDALRDERVLEAAERERLIACLLMGRSAPPGIGRKSLLRALRQSLARLRDDRERDA